MRVLVCGGRDYRDAAKVDEVLSLKLCDAPGFTLICGYDPYDNRYQGADQLAYEWAIERNIPVAPFPAPWHRFGNSAGPRRNAQMLSDMRPHMVIAFPGGRGTADMTKKAREGGVFVKVIEP